MNLRKKIILFFSITFGFVLGITMLIVFFSMAEYREQEFAQRLKEKTITTLRLLIDVKEIDHDLLQALDETTINNLYDEKILLFDSAGHMIYSSVDDIVIPFSKEILDQLKTDEIEIAYREGDYDVYAHRMDDKGKTFYAIAVGLEKTINSQKPEYRKILITRPNVQFDADIGFLPGSEQDKISPLIRPVIDNLEQLIDSNEEERYQNEKDDGS